MSDNYKPSGIDWADPYDPAAGMFCKVTPRKGRPPEHPVMATANHFVIWANEKFGGSITPAGLLYHVRVLALRFPLFRAELIEMVSKLPPEENP